MADAKQKLIIDVVAKNTAALGGVAAGLNSVKASALGAGAAMRVLGPLFAVLVTGKLTYNFKHCRRFCRRWCGGI